MLRYGTHKPYDDDDDDDYHYWEDNDDNKCTDTIIINTSKNYIMDKFFKFNWFITLNSNNSQYLVSFVNILSVNLEVDEETRKMAWNKKQQTFVEIDPDNFSEIDMRTLEGLGEIKTEIIKHTTLVIGTATRTYRCKMDNEEGKYWYEIFSKNSFFNHASLFDPHITIRCDEIEIIRE